MSLFLLFLPSRFLLQLGAAKAAAGNFAAAEATLTESIDLWRTTPGGLKRDLIERHKAMVDLYSRWSEAAPTAATQKLQEWPQGLSTVQDEKPSQ